MSNRYASTPLESALSGWKPRKPSLETRSLNPSKTMLGCVNYKRSLMLR